MFDRAITLEFYVDNSKELCVEYNTAKYTFSDFWQNVHDSKEICRLVYHAFEKQHPDKFKAASLGAKNWEEIFLKIINNHFRKYDKNIDIFIRTNGDVINELILVNPEYVITDFNRLKIISDQTKIIDKNNKIIQELQDKLMGKNINKELKND